MDSNSNNNNDKQEVKWYKLPLRDWAIIIGFFAYYMNAAGASAAYSAKLEMIVKEVSDMKTIFKEMQQQQKTDYKYLEDRHNRVATELEVLKQRVETLENK